MEMVKENGTTKKKLNVAIVGGGLVGALNACYLAKKGHEVHLYELRDDIRLMEHVPGRSINLAMSIRGRSALKEVGLEDSVIRDHGIPMEARMIHRPDGTTYSIPYGKKGQCIYSVGRRFVNEVLLNAAEKYSNVHFHFEHKLVTANLTKAKMEFEDVKAKKQVEVDADVIVGCDGAYSAIRKQMMKMPMFNYSQTYIPTVYMELCIPPDEEGNFRMPSSYLHIWPRGKFMMIALPNQDKSWTVTLFMPKEIFDGLTTPEKLIDFFNQHYADAVPLIGKEKLVKDFFAGKPSPLISVKCSPYHVGSTCVIMGDAAHAMVPFYGQGMNAGFEDCLIFNELLERFDNDLSLVLPEFTRFRNPDAEAICDLALYNYIEMRDLVNQLSFRLRKKLDNALYWLLPRTWVPLYTSVTFSRIRYHECISNKKWQDEVVKKGLWGLGAVLSTAVAYNLYSSWIPLKELAGDYEKLLGRFVGPM